MSLWKYGENKSILGSAIGVGLFKSALTNAGMTGTAQVVGGVGTSAAMTTANVGVGTAGLAPAVISGTSAVTTFVTGALGGLGTVAVLLLVVGSIVYGMKKLTED